MIRELEILSISYAGSPNTRWKYLTSNAIAYGIRSLNTVFFWIGKGDEKERKKEVVGLEVNKKTSELPLIIKGMPI